MEDLITYLEEHRGPWSYLVIAASALIEYVVPPFPGDTVALGAVFLAATAGYSPWLVHLALTAGSIVGGQGAWGFGRWVAARREVSPRFLHGRRTEKALREVQARFERHGPWYLAVNRFVPALRAFFFVAAGMSGMSFWRVAFWGGLSAAAWNGLILAVGFSVGRNLEALERLYERYTWGALIVVGLVLAVFLWRVLRGNGDEDG
ncbi:MAG TPA: DedA family protein [Polyangiaceae bacterium LLY-WYZ-15_(1-7)]|nr:DedA family protein [Polyangiaceae bacterium LLY-WYZ-15_(1-7)]HJL10043.1 DedA family protein [Polyangiaceae bacterium LLY-WYZ-15_(1-7)]HJL25727.1 DedA family protein [Polyangiaceae bacterium LLY-WYZ-15_(1-7)]HJL36684.1 DedA family protein [Polyangiaceae bacterium LLY-WYZ-15_(1-7)]HJL48229.1 DedA family protein [Polyangiaceae bacterium LLY-WYZ-15_(1-7)]